jgi:hypothetical protein
MSSTVPSARVIKPVTHLPFINADKIAHARWPGEELEHSYDAAAIAAAARTECLVNASRLLMRLCSRTRQGSRCCGLRTMPGIAPSCTSS